jgi:hypothetical protein
VNSRNRQRRLALIARTPYGPRLREAWTTAVLAWNVSVAKKELWSGMNDPFNGQRMRLKTIRSLVAEFDPDSFIETGTFIGSTTRFFSGNGVPVFTSEMKRVFWLLARLRLGWRSNVTTVRCDSRAMLESLTQGRSFVRPFVYLDAHWWGDFPLTAELDLVLRSWEDVIVVIDDFRVPGDEGYGYDVYEGHPLAIEELTLPATTAVAFPAQPSEAETGARRGALFLGKGPGAQQALEHAAEQGLLRRVR